MERRLPLTVVMQLSYLSMYTYVYTSIESRVPDKGLSAQSCARYVVRAVLLPCG